MGHSKGTHSCISHCILHKLANTFEGQPHVKCITIIHLGDHPGGHQGMSDHEQNFPIQEQMQLVHKTELYKGLLATTATYLLSRSHESRRTSDCTLSLFGAMQPCPVPKMALSLKWRAPKSIAIQSCNSRVAR